MATRTLSFSNISLFFYRSNRSLSNPISFSFFIPRRPTNGVVSPPSLCLPNSSSSSFSFSTAPSTPYPLQYELIVHRPPQNPHQTQATHRRRLLRQGPNPPNSNPTDSPDSESETSTSELSQDLAFEDWADRKVAQNDATKAPGWAASPETMDKAKRKYYNKRNRRMYGSDSEDESRRRAGDGFVELRPEFVELKTLHKREEELYFYDALAYPWEKDKHYKMVYQLEKKYFPDQSFDRAFLQPGESDYGGGMSGEGGKKRQGEKSVGKRWVRGGKDGKGEEGEKGLIFFDEKGGEISSGEGKDAGKSGGGDKGISEKKVEEFFKCLKKVPSKNAEISSANTEPFLASRRTGLPPTWDSPGGTVVLINKPKGWTSFTVCGKLRRLVNVKKVGHAGTLDPMATGLLIVCVGKSTKLVDRYQGMIKGYTGIFRLGEATSTWDADSPVLVLN